jgi:hypothetical protein
VIHITDREKYYAKLLANFCEDFADFAAPAAVEFLSLNLQATNEAFMFYSSTCLAMRVGHSKARRIDLTMGARGREDIRREAVLSSHV